MELSVKTNKTKVARCPNCLNYMKMITTKDSAMKGICPVCKCVIFSKKKSCTETIIRVVTQQCNT